MTLLGLILIILLVAVVLGALGHTQWQWGYAGWSPVGILLLILLVLWLTGHHSYRVW